MRFDPGPGVGGHCLPVDPAYLSWEIRRRTGTPLHLVETANQINNSMPTHVVHRLTQALNTRGLPVNESHVLLLGIAYKPDTGDTRHSPAITIAQNLTALGARIRVVDPHVNEPFSLDPRTVLPRLTKTSLKAADAVVLLTDHTAFGLPLIEQHAPYVLDCRARLKGPNVEHL
ncbi:UDP binding domain-containing protein [Streptomyces sp. SCSIO 30461]|uniref:UDP binding domain-containing protein n=1 Tax=Streptomyces sp. SCSIO 30461 TaxID=3118085 RepID=UPI0030CF9559